MPWVSPVKAWLQTPARGFSFRRIHISYIGSTVHEELMQDKMIGKALWGSLA